MTIALIIAGMALINLLVRCPLFLMARRVRLPLVFERGLSYTPVAVLTAFVLPAALHLDQAPNGAEVFNPDLVAALAAAAVSWFTHRLLLTVGVGLALAIGLRALG